MPLAPDEVDIWDGPSPPAVGPKRDEQIDARYERESRALVLESNREKLQNFYEALRRPNYMDVQPYFQRRSVWTPKQQSRFIESFLLNIPVPPLFVYEVRANQYEVIDGQQRIRAIRDFFSGALTLTEMEHWPELNGRTYQTLPPGVRAGIERRSISWTVIMKESARDDRDSAFIRQAVFERLNTGGTSMSAQELRNSFYAGDFNMLLRRLAEDPAVRTVWAPTYRRGHDHHPPEGSKRDIKFVERMGDVELVLRFFAYRHADHMRGPANRFLDAYMAHAMTFGKASRSQMEQLFRDTFRLAVELYGEKVFRAYDAERGVWERDPMKVVADAELVALSDQLAHRDRLVAAKDKVVKATERLFRKHPLEELWAHGSADVVRKRVRLFRNLYNRIGG